MCPSKSKPRTSAAQVDAYRFSCKAAELEDDLATDHWACEGLRSTGCSVVDYPTALWSPGEHDYDGLLCSFCMLTYSFQALTALSEGVPC
jgi:hypothetical protein